MKEMTPKEAFELAIEAHGGLMEKMTQDLEELSDENEGCEPDEEETNLRSLWEVSTIIHVLAKVGYAFSQGDEVEARRILKVFEDENHG